MKIRKSTLDDFDKIMNIYGYARDFMTKNGNPNQWAKNNWPPSDLIRDDIEKSNSYVCLNDNDEVIGTFYYVYGYDIEPTYKNIYDGHWLNDEPYGVVHRIAADGSEKGIGTFCINWAVDECKHLRIDTHVDNVVMKNLLTKLGFTYCGIIHIGDSSNKRLAYEKIV